MAAKNKDETMEEEAELEAVTTENGMTELDRGLKETAADRLGKEQRVISIAEFFERNKHLLGYENLQKSLLTCIREGVDNSLDACEEARILPNIYVEVKQLANSRYKIVMEDNGPGIVKKHIPRIFAKLLYGSKFFRLQQSRGQQGIGISAAVLYSQLTTGKPTKIYSRTGDGKTHIYELRIDTTKNEPEIVSEQSVFGDGHGTRIEMEVEGKYVKGRQSVEEYLKQTAIMNPYAKIVFVDPEGSQIEYPRVIEKLPTKAKSIKPHPRGIEIGILIRMFKNTKARNLTGFFTNEFSRIGRGTAVQICRDAQVDPKLNPKTITREEVERLHGAIENVKLQNPPTNVLSPAGEKSIKEGIKKEMNPELIVVVSRPPAVYEGRPFQIECGLAYGGDLDPEGQIKIMRFANKVPLLYQQSSCAVTKAVLETAWKRYKIAQSKGALPNGPIAVVVHMASVWIPYTSEGKEAIALYPAIVKEIKLAVQEAARKLSVYIGRKRRVAIAEEKKRLFEQYAVEVAAALSGLTGKNKDEIHKKIVALTEEKLDIALEEFAQKGVELNPESEKLAKRKMEDEEGEGDEDGE